MVRCAVRSGRLSIRIDVEEEIVCSSLVYNRHLVSSYSYLVSASFSSLSWSFSLVATWESRSHGCVHLLPKQCLPRKVAARLESLSSWPFFSLSFDLLSFLDDFVRQAIFILINLYHPIVLPSLDILPIDKKVEKSWDDVQKS